MAAKRSFTASKLPGTRSSSVPLLIPNDMTYDSSSNKLKKIAGRERNGLSIVEEGVQLLKSIKHPLAVLAIGGPCRSGKSYLLSRFLGTPDAFALGHRFDPETAGVWIGTTVLACDQFTVVLMDTEGIDSVFAKTRDDACILVMTLLLSSFFIYNSLGVPHHSDLENMRFVANLSKSIQVQAGQSPDEAERVKLADCNPKFMWLLRDATLTPTDANGKDCHFKDYLLQKVLVDDASSDDTDKNIHQCILNFFSGFDAETLPPPSSDENVMQDIENPLYQKHISAFLDQVEYVKKKVFDNCTPKKGLSEGSIISGFQLAHMVELYVEALNSPGGIPIIGSTWQRVLEATYTDGIEKAFKTYCETMTTVLPNLPMENGQLLKVHRDALEKSMETFNKAVSLDSQSELCQTYREKLMTKIEVCDDKGECRGGEFDQYFKKNYDRSKLTCQSYLNDLREKYLDPIINHLTLETDFNTIDFAFCKIIDEYKSGIKEKKCVGPASDDVLKQFKEEQEKQRSQLELQLSLIKKYDEVEKLKRKQVEDEKVFLEQKEIELQQKMKESAKDQEEKAKVMQDKLAREADAARKEQEKQLEEEQKLLQEMAEAEIQKAKEEQEMQLRLERAALQRREEERRQQLAREQAEIRRRQEEAEQLRRQHEEASSSRDDDNCIIL